MTVHIIKNFAKNNLTHVLYAHLHADVLCNLLVKGYTILYLYNIMHYLYYCSFTKSSSK